MSRTGRRESLFIQKSVWRKSLEKYLWTIASSFAIVPYFLRYVFSTLPHRIKMSGLTFKWVFKSFAPFTSPCRRSLNGGASVRGNSMFWVRGKENSVNMWTFADVGCMWNSKSCHNVEKNIPYLYVESNLSRTWKLELHYWDYYQCLPLTVIKLKNWHFIIIPYFVNGIFMSCVIFYFLVVLLDALHYMYKGEGMSMTWLFSSKYPSPRPFLDLRKENLTKNLFTPSWPKSSTF